MPAADHVVLTNVSAPLHPEDPPVSPDRLWYLLGFFLDACVASVTRQRHVRPTWLVWFDDRCEPDAREEIERLSTGAFTAVWCHDALTPAAVAQEVSLHTKAPTLITTVIDCDDAMATDYLATVSALNHDEGTILVTSPNGLVTDRTGGVFATRNPDSPLRSMIESRVPGALPRTVLGDVAGARSATLSGPQWMDVHHDPNVAAPVRGRRVHPRMVAERFDLDLTYGNGATRAEGHRARRSDMRRVAQSLMQAPAIGNTAGRVLHGARSVGWRTDEGLNTLVDQARRRRAPAGLKPIAGEPHALFNANRVAVLAEYAQGAHVRPWALRMATALAEVGYPCLIVCARDRGRSVAAPTDLAPGLAIVSRTNARYDFGSWAAALQAFPAIAETQHVLLTNDSIIGPLSGRSEELGALLSRAEQSDASVYAATRGFGGYLQSYFLLFNQQVLARPAIRDFFGTLPRTRDRRDLVQRYEHGLSQLLIDQEVDLDAAWDAASLGLSAEFNPPLCWRELLDAGFPFVKRRLLTHPRFETVRPLIIDYARERYSVDLAQGL